MAAQRADVFTRTLAYSGRATNAVTVHYIGTQFSRIYTVLPCPVNNEYQQISSHAAPGCTAGACPDGINYYFWKDLDDSNIPQSGDCVISDTFDANVYFVKVDFSKMTDIPAYDSGSEECRKYLGKEGRGLIDPTNRTIAATADTLWKQAGGDIICYARACNKWAHDNIHYGNPFTGLYRISELMKSRTGDCGNISSVFISLLRAKGIPARHLVLVHGNGGENHIRAEFYVPAYGWIPADPTFGDAFFGVFAGNYIVVARGGIGQTIRAHDGGNWQVDCRTYSNWYWWLTKGSFSFTQTCTGLQIVR